jgi:predicted nucleic acid-binding protein
LIVTDASVIVTSLADDGPDGDFARDRLNGERLTAPHLIDVEVVSAWRRLVANGQIDGRRAQLAMNDLSDLRIDRVPHAPLLERAWELRQNLTIYDGVYIALAERLDVTLVTADVRLAQAPGARCGIEVLGQPA